MHGFNLFSLETKTRIVTIQMKLRSSCAVLSSCAVYYAVQVAQFNF